MLYDHVEPRFRHILPEIVEYLPRSDGLEKDVVTDQLEYGAPAVSGAFR